MHYTGEFQKRIGKGLRVGLEFALCRLPVGRVGRVRRVGHLIFKNEMPESFALGRYLGFSVENCFRKALDVSQSRVLHSLVENCFRKALQVNFKKPLSYASYASCTSYFAICQREAQCLALRHASREAPRKWGCALRVVNALPEMNLTLLDGDAVRSGVLDKIELLVMPGGSSPAIKKDLNPEGTEKLKAFINAFLSRGGRMVGWGAGVKQLPKDGKVCTNGADGVSFLEAEAAK